MNTQLQEISVEQNYFSVKETAKFVGLSTDKVRDWIVQGVLPCSNVGTPDRPIYRIAKDEIRNLMKRLESGPISPARQTSLPFSLHRKN